MFLNLTLNNPKKWLERSIQDGYIRYYLEEDLLQRSIVGIGGFGVVSKAKVRQSGDTVAVKLLLRNRTKSEDEFYEQFVKEVRSRFPIKLWSLMSYVPC